MTIVVLLVCLSVLIIVHEWGHFATARRLGVRVERFSIGFGPRLWRWKPGETEYAVSLFPLGGYVKLAGESPEARTGASWEYGSRPVWQRAGIVAAGPVVNYVTGLALFIMIFWAGFPRLAPTVGGLVEGYPAAAAGVRAGDRIAAVNGRPVDSWEAVTTQIRQATSGAPIQLAIRRDGAEQMIAVSPQITAGVAVIGMTPAEEIQIIRYALPRAIVEGAQRAWWLTVMTYQALWQLATGALPIKESLTGPVGIFYLTSSAAALGWRYVAQLMAVLSVSLAIFNLLPIPVLDGGHLLFLGIERLRRRPVSLKVQAVMTQAGMYLLLGVLLLVTYNDLVKFQLLQRVTHWLK